MKKALAILVGGILTYLAVATAVYEPHLVGRVGNFFAAANRKYFGYLAFVDLLVLFYMLYLFYRVPKITPENAKKALSALLFLFAMLLLQALLVGQEMGGVIGISAIELLAPYIGMAGIWIFWAILTALSLAIFIEDGMFKWTFKKPSFVLPSFTLNFLHFKAKEPNNPESKNQAVSKKLQDTQISCQIPEAKPSAHYDEPECEPQPIRLIEKEQQKPQIAVANPTCKKEIPAAAPKPTLITEIVQELEENKKLLSQLEQGEQQKPENFKLPSTDFLTKPPKKRSEINEAEIDEKIKDLLEKLAKFNIEGDVVRTYAGPVVTTFEFKPAPHVKVSKILGLQDDLAMALRAQTIRIQAPIPGKDVIGIEIPNREVETIYLREILEDEIFQKSASPLTLALGKDIVGKPFVTDLKKLPHLLIAGTTGSGKSVGINAMILSLLYKNSPDNLKLLMIDPKMLEFSIYNNIPHLLTPVITKPKQAVAALSNMVGEMERRYQLMSQSRTKNIENYNEKAKREKMAPLPYIVVTIDELADLMMTSGKEVEISIARLAQMARASGIHLIVATQRPSVDVVTGLIKANLPSRISFKVGQKIDSKVILDTLGAESLLGRGDMLFTPPGMSGLIRLHAPWVSEEEIEKIVGFLKSQRQPEYDVRFLVESEGGSVQEGTPFGEELDELFEEARQIVLKEQKSSISHIQRRLQIGYNRAARIVEQLEAAGVLSAPNNKGNREILGT